MRIAVGGFQHETNTFAPVKADFQAFERADAWPRLIVGEEIWDEIEGVHIPIAGACDVLKAAGVDLVPLAWASATPSAHVTEDAYERIAGLMLERLRSAMPVDAVYLDLHGAMVCEHHEDGEGELLRRVREVVGPDKPITISMDLHANVTPEMVEHADLIEIYRNYPHTDMAETGARAARHLLTILAMGTKPAKAFRQADFLIPLQWGCTFHDPAQTLYEKNLQDGLESGVMSLSFACGFPLADIHHCGPSVVAYANNQKDADEAADVMMAAVQAAEPDFAGKIYLPDEAVRLGHNVGNGKPLVVADSQDNPGGGGPGDTTGMLRALLEAGRQDALIGVFTDPETADKAHDTGIGGTFTAKIGGKLFPGDEPVEVEATVLALGDGVFKGTGPMWGGAKFQMGRMALLDCKGVHVAIMSNSMQAGDQSMFRHLGAEPSDYDLVIVKSSVHFRADFQPIARDVWVAAAPGPVYADPGGLEFNNLRAGVATRPRI
ncbi:M81 family peptidase [Hwanghaeella grinnelliae]|uniref:Microcystinase C n=1 Tax=Hwanghaeella grinnelliae TaxID=2500179 RepID=A0A437QXG6_9PROT|nr:M81 family metallopeptidase [Hwanghaeella grinnelliae]RVU39220.1 M81 family peptidase [Hwanghaeella grinnelliae]